MTIRCRIVPSLRVLLVGITGLSAEAAPPSKAQSAGLPPAEAAFFKDKVLPIFQRRCYECHSHEAKKIKGGLVLDSASGLKEGGSSGSCITPGKPNESLLIKSVRYEVADQEMPPKEKLPPEEIEVLVEWVKRGAPDARPVTAQGAWVITDEARNHWSFQPLSTTTPPPVKNSTWVKSPVDAFVLAKLEEKGLTPAAAADKRTLIRRATYDLTGLPPKPEEVDAFLKDSSADSYQNLVERLLASPQYGERWARHWLDVARYADTTGTAGVGGRDSRYLFAWTYRDYVVRAFNEDWPFNRFIEEQLAADKIPGGEKSALAALGFLTVGKRFDNNNQDDIIDDRIDVVSRGFMGLTVNCARCHDHKFDPIPTADYYSWHGIFSSCMEPEEMPLLADPPQTPEYADFQQQTAAAQRAIDEYTDNQWERHLGEHHSKIGTYLVALRDWEKGRREGLSLNAFYRSRELTQGIGQKWDLWFKQLAKEKKPPHEVFGPWVALAALPDEEFAAKSAALLTEMRQGLLSGQKLNRAIVKELSGMEAPKTLGEVAAAYSRAFTEALKARAAKREELLKSAGGWKAVMEIDLLDEAQQALSSLVHGASAPADRTKLTFNGELGVQANGERGKLLAKLNDIIATHAGSPARAMALNDAPKPKNSRIYLRGDRAKQGNEVQRRFLEIISPKDRKPFTNGSGRLELAQAIASPENPLTARVFANRVWLHHFGHGLVSTPSDFGLRGDKPSHPELLDWLARQFIEQGWSVKKLHRLILLSNTYQQRSDQSPKAREIDPSNTLMSHMNRRRLDVEAMRDTILAAAGTLKAEVGGRPADLLADTRRTIYSSIVRENVSSTLMTFDFPLPDLSSPQRFETTVPTQALFLMNSPFVIEQAKRLVDRPEVEKAPNEEERIRALYRILFQRGPRSEDVADAKAFLKAQAKVKIEQQPPPDWHYGAVVDRKGVMQFIESKAFANEGWQVYEKLEGTPAASLKLGKPGIQVRVTAAGGTTGAALGAVRRWIAPMDAVVALDGQLSVEGNASDLLATMELRRGKEAPKALGSWSKVAGKVATSLERLEVKKGDIIDFCVRNVKNRPPVKFTWAPALRQMEMPDGESGRQWHALEDFSGPPPPPPKGLEVWEKFAQALLLTNELVYVN